MTKQQLWIRIVLGSMAVAGYTFLAIAVFNIWFQEWQAL